ncbi:endonuclease domain-containing protein [Sphingomonas sp. NY01]|uniref:endonuclease domain-containing protein n=1 Tax=Sphingomonas sp. NY01 TaxID=2968057 RepID=UPI00315D3FA9
MTLPEVLLWEQLRGRRCGLRFRRQHPVGPYVADFCCLAERLIVEVDGEAHGRGDRPCCDRTRDRFLEENGFRVLRIAAADVQRDVEAVVASIVAYAGRPLHHQPLAGGPPPRSGEE